MTAVYIRLEGQHESIVLNWKIKINDDRRQSGQAQCREKLLKNFASDIVFE